MLANFWNKGPNNGKAIITGKRVDRGAGYGLEIPCSYIFYGDNDISSPWLGGKDGKHWDNFNVAGPECWQIRTVYFRPTDTQELL